MVDGHTLLHRRARGAFLLALALLFASTPLERRSNAAEAAAKIYVYLPSTVRPPMLQKALSEALPGATVIVYRHLRDFESSVVESPPDLVIAARPLLEQHSGWTPVLQGFANRRGDEAYVLVSVGQPIAPAAAAAAGIGVVDLLGKKAMPTFVAGLLGAAMLPKLTRVAQPEDLLPLLELEMAKAVLMPARAVPGLREKSTLDLRVVEIKEARIGLPALAALSVTPAVKAVQRKLVELPPNIQTMLGVEEWRRP